MKYSLLLNYLFIWNYSEQILVRWVLTGLNVNKTNCFSKLSGNKLRKNNLLYNNVFLTFIENDHCI